MLIKISIILEFSMKFGCAFLIVKLWKGKPRGQFFYFLLPFAQGQECSILKFGLVGILHSESPCRTQGMASACILLHSWIPRNYSPAAVAWEYLKRVCQGEWHLVSHVFKCLFRRATGNLKCWVTLTNPQVSSHVNSRVTFHHGFFLEEKIISFSYSYSLQTQLC